MTIDTIASSRRKPNDNASWKPLGDPDVISKADAFAFNATRASWLLGQGPRDGT